MHPLRHLFDDINRNHWGIDPRGNDKARNRSRLRRVLLRHAVGQR